MTDLIKNVPGYREHRCPECGSPRWDQQPGPDIADGWDYYWCSDCGEPFVTHEGEFLPIDPYADNPYA